MLVCTLIAILRFTAPAATSCYGVLSSRSRTTLQSYTWQARSPVLHVRNIKLKYTPAARSKVSAKLIFSICVILRSRVLLGVCPH